MRRMIAGIHGRWFNYANNPLSIAGIVITTVSALLIIIFMVAGLAGAFHNPYVGIFAYLILPAIFVLGLILIPIGMWRRRQRLIADGQTEEERDRFPRLDFNSPRLRRLGLLVLALTAVNAVILGATSYLAVEEMETVEFCGTTCHTVMQPEYTAYQESPHSRVACVECHIGPGADFFVRSKIDGLRQVWKVAIDSYPTPIETPIHNLRPAQETCEQCHWPLKHHGDKLRLFADFAPDEANTPNYTVLLLRTGGGAMDLGSHGGIHWWHIYSDNRIRYWAADEDRQEIDWVELTTPDGETLTYTREGQELPPMEEIEAEARLMDCIDCHNRPTHLFKHPNEALDEVLVARPELTQLPYFKRTALAAIEGEYETWDEGVETVAAEVRAFYADDYPDLVATHDDLIELGATEAAAVFSRSVFPEMQTTWETHPNNIGHQEFPGCYRCHDGELQTTGGERWISQDCEKCHVFVSMGERERPDLQDLGL